MGKSKKNARKVNPCWSKGRNLGRGGQGKTSSMLGCECKYRAEFFSPPKGNDDASTNAVTHTASYSLFVKNNRLRIVEEQSKDAPKEGFLIQPCQAAFLEKSSDGTKLFLEHNSASKFTGCIELENDLIKEDLVNNTPFDGDRGHQTFGREEVFEAQVMAAQYGVESVFIYKGTLREISSPHPINLRHSVLRKLMHEMEPFLDGDGKVQYQTAIIIDRGLNTKDHEYMIDIIFPDYPLNEFKRHEAKISLLVAREIKRINLQTNDRLGRLQKAWKNLTDNQRDVVLAFYGDDDELSMRDIAEKLKISESSARDRLKGAKEKIKKAFPDLVPLAQQEKSYTKADLEKRESQYDGFYRRSNAEKIHPCTVTNVKTGDMTVVNQEQLIFDEEYNPAKKRKIWAWINKVSPSPLATDFGGYESKRNDKDSRGQKEEP